MIPLKGTQWKQENLTMFYVSTLYVRGEGVVNSIFSWDPVYFVGVIVTPMNQHKYLKFEPNNPPPCTYPPKVGHAHFPHRRTLSEEILIIFVMF